MNQYEAKKAIAQQWIAAWPAASGSVAYAFDNDVVDESSSYARVKFIGGTSEQYSLGQAPSRRWIREGFVRVLLKTPVNAGSKAMDLLVGAVRTVLEGVRVGASGTEVGVVLEAASAGQESTDGQFYSSVVTVPFTYYEAR